MSYAAFGKKPLADLVETAGGSDRLTLLVGAGASMEAGLPSWESLIGKLLRRAAKHRRLIDVSNSDALARWQAEAVRDGYLGAAAIVDALAGRARDRWLIAALFGPEGPAAYFPGAISRQIPWLNRVFGSGLRVLTMNYDDLIEQAFRDEKGGIEPAPLATESLRHPPGTFPIHHLHGHVQRDGKVLGKLVLSEADYQRTQAAEAWQGDLVRTALRDSTVVFVGTSLIDPNLLRYLHGVRQDLQDSGAYAVFVRQGVYPKDVPAGIREAREKALSARWAALGVTPVFVDHFVDVAQVLYEIGRRRQQGDDYVGLDERAQTWVETVERGVLRFTDGDAAFEATQQELRRLLRDILRRAVSTAERIEGVDFDEVLACQLWLADHRGEHLTTWLASDRVHAECATVERVPIGEHSSWAAVRAFCFGTPLAEPRDVYASRWRFVRAVPLVVEDEPHGRIPVGALTVSSRLPQEKSRLHLMRSDVQRGFTQTLERTVRTLLARPGA